MTPKFVVSRSHQPLGRLEANSIAYALTINALEK